MRKGDGWRGELLNSAVHDLRHVVTLLTAFTNFPYNPNYAILFVRYFR